MGRHKKLERSIVILAVVALAVLVVEFRSTSYFPTLEGSSKVTSSASPLVQLERKEFVVDETICISLECIREKASSSAFSRAFPDRSNRSWAVNYTSPLTDRLKRGILVTKPPKSASTTAASVALQIAKRNGNVPVLYRHGLPSVLRYGHRHPTESFMLAPVRHPVQRAFSYIFYHISRLGIDWNETYVMDQLEHFDTTIQDDASARSGGRGGFQLRYLSVIAIPPHSAYSPEFPTKVLQPRRQGGALKVENNVQRLVQQDYDFLLVVDRMDESLVALAMTLGISINDVIVASSKVSGRTYLPVSRPGKPTKVCVPLQPPQSTTAIDAYLASDTWRAQNYGDYLLYHAAHASLDKTIDRIGPSVFAAALQTYRERKQAALTTCASSIHLPCSGKGIFQPDLSDQSCFVEDLGCGHECIGRFLSEKFGR